MYVAPVTVEGHGVGSEPGVVIPRVVPGVALVGSVTAYTSIAKLFMMSILNTFKLLDAQGVVIS